MSRAGPKEKTSMTTQPISRFPVPDVADLPQDIADRILAGHAKDADDALVVVVRYLPT